jgi:HK97 gp10 family phage protein
MGNGFDITEFNELIKQIESLGADTEQIAEKVLNAGSEPARRVFQIHVPVDRTTPEEKRRHPHAKNNIIVSKTKKSKKGSKYRVIGAEDKTFVYLWYLEKGTITIHGKQFLEKAERAARAVASEPMERALLQEIENHLK